LKTQTNKPWIDQNGKLLSDEEIRSLSTEWSAETWEAFLQATVEVDLSTHEVLTPKYESLCEEETETHWGPPCRLPVVVQKEIVSAVRKLKERPRKVIRLHYWADLSIREIGKIEKLSFCRVQQIKFFSLNQIRDLLAFALHTPSYLIGGSEHFDLPATRDEDIKEVYRADLEGSYLK